jgi:DNA (cytosine-5)-methyltransferase 1
MNNGSLFSGIGGIEIGLEAAGINTEWFVEKDKYCQEILRKHWSSTIIYDDITQVDFRTVPKVDMLTGGFPCQDISYAGKGAGIAGSRSSLWKYYLKAISEIRPKFALIENVPALVKRGLNVVLSDLAQIGYDAEWYNISASSVGAPHKRERIFIIACLRSDTQCEWGGAECESLEKQKTWIDNNGICEHVPDTNSFGCMDGQLTEFTDKRGKQAQRGTVPRCENVAHTSSDGFKDRYKDEGRTNSCSKTRGLQQFKRGSDKENVSNMQGEGRKLWTKGEQELLSQSKETISRRNSNESGKGIWFSEPNVGRVVNGLPFRVDRLKCLGNAVVPQCAEVFAKAIKEYEEGVK